MKYIKGNSYPLVPHGRTINILFIKKSGFHPISSINEFTFLASDAAMNEQYLLRHGITYILNAAGNTCGPAPVKTGPDYYKVRIAVEISSAKEPYCRISKFLFFIANSFFIAVILLNGFINCFTYSFVFRILP